MKGKREKLRLEIIEKLKEYLELIEDPYCDGCPALNVKQVFNGSNETMQGYMEEMKEFTAI